MDCEFKVIIPNNLIGELLVRHNGFLFDEWNFSHTLNDWFYENIKYDFAVNLFNDPFYIKFQDRDDAILFKTTWI